MKFILGKKIEMTQIFSNNKRIPVTKVKAGPCVVTQIKTADGKDGYCAVQIGFEKKKKNIKKYHGDKPFKYLAEFRLDKKPDLKLKDKLTVKQFEKGDKLKTTGTSKGKGFQGVMKRHGFAGFPRSHGHNKGHTRSPGSIGATDPERVFPNKKMAGRTGGDTITTSNLELVDIDDSKNILFIKGSIPGSRGSFLKIKSD